MRGYKASILSVISLEGKLPTSTETILSRLFKAFASERPASPAALPNWNLSIVLQGFKKAPFEPLDDCSLEQLLVKTLFLTFLASGARGGEILAVTSNVRFRITEGCNEAVLYPNPGFVPKTKRGVSSNRPFVIRSLEDHSHLVEDKFLCPVRALKAFVARSVHLRADDSRLFLKFDETPPKGLSHHSLKSLLLQAINLSYKAMGIPQEPEITVRLHELRRLSFSLASGSGVSLETIMKAARWKHPSVFTTYYLQDAALYDDGWQVLGPLSVAATVVVPRRQLKDLQVVKVYLFSCLNRYLLGILYPLLQKGSPWGIDPSLTSSGFDFDVIVNF